METELPKYKESYEKTWILEELYSLSSYKKFEQILLRIAIYKKLNTNMPPFTKQSSPRPGLAQRVSFTTKNKTVIYNVHFDNPDIQPS